MEQVVEAATAKKIPVYGSDPVMVQKGALASVSVSNTQLGEKAADMADKILKVLRIGGSRSCAHGLSVCHKQQDRKHTRY